jgi:photosystem II stability/assembly factor-like uncharacterized protein
MKKLLRLLLSAVGLAAFAGEAVAQQYVSSGPYGGAVYSFYRDNARILAAGSGGIYISTDEGKSWQELALQPAVFGCDQLYSVAVLGPEMYAGSRQTGIYHSQDAGSTWAPTATGLRVAPGAPFTDLEFVGANILAVRPDSGFLFLSINQGNTWNRINLAINNSSAQFLSSHNNEVYVSTPQGLYKSFNGISFVTVDTVRSDFGQLTWSGDTAYAATATGIKMSTNSGASFTTVALAGRAVRRVAVMGKNMYAVVRNPAPIQDSVLYSTDGGANFTAAPFNAGNFRFTTVTDLLATNTGVLVASNYGLYGSKDNGTSWGKLDSGYNATVIRGLATGGAYVYAAAYPMGVYRVMPDSGTLMWQHSGDLSDGIDGSVQTIAAKGGIVHLGAVSGYYRSADSGATWMVGVAGATGGNITSIYASPTTSDVWMIRNGNLTYSGDSGLSFGIVINSNIPLGVAQRVMKADTVVFVSSYSTLYKGGSTMIFNTVSGLGGFVTAVVHEGNTFYAATDANGLFSSPDGNNWTMAVINGSLPYKINTLIPDSAGTGLIAGTDDGVYTNSNGGVWTQLALPGHSVQSLVIRNGKLFIGTCSGAYSVPYKIIPPPAGVGGPSIKTASLEIWPNPTRGDCTLRISSARSGEGEVWLRDMMGTTVLHQKVPLKSGVNELHLPLRGLRLAAGVYTVQVSGEAIQAAGRVVVY